MKFKKKTRLLALIFLSQNIIFTNLRCIFIDPYDQCIAYGANDCEMYLVGDNYDLTSDPIWEKIYLPSEKSDFVFVRGFRYDGKHFFMILKRNIDDSYSKLYVSDPFNVDPDMYRKDKCSAVNCLTIHIHNAILINGHNGKISMEMITQTCNGAPEDDLCHNKTFIYSIKFNNIPDELKNKITKINCIGNIYTIWDEQKHMKNNSSN